MYKLLIFLLILSSTVKAQLLFNNTVDLGIITEAYEIRGDITLSNPTSKKIFLLRADAENGLKVYTSKKTLLPGDTALLVISFNPRNNGRFKKKINLVCSDRGTPYEIIISGDLLKYK